MTESTKLTADDFYLESKINDEEFNETYQKYCIHIIDNDNKIAKQIKQQILENQEIVNDIIKIVKRKPHSDEDKAIIKVLREILSENKNLDFKEEPLV